MKSNDSGASQYDEPISEGENAPGLPVRVRLMIGATAVLILGVSVFALISYINDPNRFASPKDLQLSTVIIFSVGILIFALVPWETLGIRIKKIGSVEFATVVNTQAREHAEEFGELRARITDLEEIVKRLDGAESLGTHLASQDVSPVLLEFLEQHQPQAFSPLRLHRWGAQQPGFEKLGQYSQGVLRSILQELLLLGKVSTRVSKLGNTLYKIADPR